MVGGLSHDIAGERQLSRHLRPAHVRVRMSARDGHTSWIFSSLGERNLKEADIVNAWEGCGCQLVVSKTETSVVKGKFVFQNADGLDTICRRRWKLSKRHCRGYPASQSTYFAFYDEMDGSPDGVVLHVATMHNAGEHEVNNAKKRKREREGHLAGEVVVQPLVSAQVFDTKLLGHFDSFYMDGVDIVGGFLFCLYVYLVRAYVRMGKLLIYYIIILFISLEGSMTCTTPSPDIPAFAYAKMRILGMVEDYQRITPTLFRIRGTGENAERDRGGDGGNRVITLRYGKNLFSLYSISVFQSLPCAYYPGAVFTCSCLFSCFPEKKRPQEEEEVREMSACMVSLVIIFCVFVSWTRRVFSFNYGTFNLNDMMVLV